MIPREDVLKEELRKFINNKTPRGREFFRDIFNEIDRVASIEINPHSDYWVWGGQYWFTLEEKLYLEVKYMKKEDMEKPFYEFLCIQI